MLSGKAISRSIREHLIVESVLITFLLSNIFPIDTEIPTTFTVYLKEEPCINQLSPFIPNEKRLTTNDLNKLMNTNIDGNNFPVELFFICSGLKGRRPF